MPAAATKNATSMVTIGPDRAWASLRRSRTRRCTHQDPDAVTQIRAKVPGNACNAGDHEARKTEGYRIVDGQSRKRDQSRHE
jgi:hypothetical protein